MVPTGTGQQEAYYHGCRKHHAHDFQSTSLPSHYTDTRDPKPNHSVLRCFSSGSHEHSYSSRPVTIFDKDSQPSWLNHSRN